jgi:hypothetical protein
VPYPMALHHGVACIARDTVDGNGSQLKFRVPCAPVEPFRYRFGGAGIWSEMLYIPPGVPVVGLYVAKFPGLPQPALLKLITAARRHSLQCCRAFEMHSILIIGEMREQARIRMASFRLLAH